MVNWADYAIHPLNCQQMSLFFVMIFTFMPKSFFLLFFKKQHAAVLI